MTARPASAARPQGRPKAISFMPFALPAASLSPGAWGPCTATNNAWRSGCSATLTERVICSAMGSMTTTNSLTMLGPKEFRLVVPKRKGARLGHRRQSPYRLRSIDLCSRPFGYGLLKQRASIDRFFGAWNSSGCGIKHLPPWVRTHFRVRLWVQAKLIFHYVRSERQTLIA